MPKYKMKYMNIWLYIYNIEKISLKAVLYILNYSRHVALLMGLGLMSAQPVTAALDKNESEKTVLIMGRYEYIIRPQAVAKPKTQAYNFEIHLRGGKWRIVYYDIETVRNNTQKGNWHEAAYDGEHIYAVRYQGDEALPEAVRSQTNQIYKNTAAIYNGNYPPPDEWTLQKIWFAIASEHAIQRHNGRLKPPFYVDKSIFYDYNGYRLNYIWETNELAAGVFGLIIWNDGTFVFREPSDGSIKHVKRSPPYHKGFTNAVATWRDPQYIAGRTIYRSFKYTEFAPMPGERESNKRLLETYSYTCKVTNVIESPLDIMLPRIDGYDVLVWDYRFNYLGVASIRYVAKNGWIAQTNLLPFAVKSRKMTLEQEFLVQMGFEQKHSQRSFTRHIIWLALALPITLVLVKGIVKTKKRKANNNENT